VNAEQASRIGGGLLPHSYKLHGRDGMCEFRLLDPRRDMDRLNIRQQPDLSTVAPGEKFPRGAKVSGARVVILDLGGEEIQEAQRCVRAGRCDQGGNNRPRWNERRTLSPHYWGIWPAQTNARHLAVSQPFAPNFCTGNRQRSQRPDFAA
jgi:hypothetical protein